MLDLIDYSSLSLFILLLILGIGLVGLTLGGDWLSKGAASLAMVLEINPVVIGLTVVSVATSMPELFTAFFASQQGNSALAVGNILGSNLGNVGLILGLTALIYPLRIQTRLILKEMPILLAATLVFTAFSYSWEITRMEGTVLILGLCGYLFYLVKSAKSGDQSFKEEILEEMPSPIKSVMACFLLVLAGSIALALGASVLVGGAVELAYRLDVNQVLIGITVVAIGTSLPELSASIAAARRKQSSLCAGNIVGSNLFNMLFVGGGVSVFYPLQINPTLFQVEFPAMLLVTALLWLMFTTDRKVTRLEGLILLCVYAVIIMLSAVSQSEFPTDVIQNLPK